MPDNSQALSDNQKLAADIREAMVILAKVIRKFGDAPWPLMERFQRELKALEDREALLESLLDEAPDSGSKRSDLLDFGSAHHLRDARFSASLSADILANHHRHIEAACSCGPSMYNAIHSPIQPPACASQRRVGSYICDAFCSA